MAQPVAADGLVYVMDSDAVVSAFDLARGRRVWRFDTKEEEDDSSNVGGGLTLDQGTLYAVNGLAELVALDVEDFDPDSGKLIVRAGKGRKQRTVYVQGGALQALLDYVAETERESGPLFVPILTGRRITERRMNAQSIYDMLKKRADQAGVKDFSPHDFRRTFVGDMLDRGVDIATVANIAGHASVDTTRRYDRRPEETKKKAATKLHFPYGGLCAVLNTTPRPLGPENSKWIDAGHH